MRLLLDTHTFLWLSTAPERLPPAVHHEIASSDNALLLSIVSLWEMTIKASKGALRLPAANIGLVVGALQGFDIQVLQLEAEDLIELQSLPFIHKIHLTERWWRRHGVTVLPS